MTGWRRRLDDAVEVAVLNHPGLTVAEISEATAITVRKIRRSLVRLRRDRTVMVIVAADGQGRWFPWPASGDEPDA